MCTLILCCVLLLCICKFWCMILIDFVYDYHCDKQKTYEAMILLIGEGRESKRLKDVCYVHETIPTLNKLEVKKRYDVNFYII